MAHFVGSIKRLAAMYSGCSRHKWLGRLNYIATTKQWKASKRAEKVAF
jgi:hypothetical protein